MISTSFLSKISSFFKKKKKHGWCDMGKPTRPRFQGCAYFAYIFAHICAYFGLFSQRVFPLAFINCFKWRDIFRLIQPPPPEGKHINCIPLQKGGSNNTRASQPMEPEIPLPWPAPDSMACSGCFFFSSHLLSSAAKPLLSWLPWPPRGANSRSFCA